MIRKLCIILVLMCLSLICIADELSFSSLENETRYQSLLPQIRCMICENQSVADSQSGFAQDMKGWVHDEIEEGRSDTEIRLALVQRFGESVLYSPMLTSSTYLLWAFPFCLVIVVLMFWYRGKNS